MANIFDAHWITSQRYMKERGLTFIRTYMLDNSDMIEKAVLEVTAMGLYEAYVNHVLVNDSLFTPGWTNYYKRLQYQTYDVTDKMSSIVTIRFEAGQGWRFHQWYPGIEGMLEPSQPAVIACLRITFKDGSEKCLMTDDSWSVRGSEIMYNNIYNGETVDFSKNGKYNPVSVVPASKEVLIPHEGEKILEHERFPGQKLIKTPKGETVIDFGQEVTGYVSFDFCGRKGDKISLVHFEMLDKKGNVYTENLRTAKQTFTVICDGEPHTAKPIFTFYGFRYIKVTGMEVTDPEVFTAIAVYSDIKLTGSFNCSDPMINKLYSNILWGQRGNFLDIPTDCPQRNERFGWTGDAQVFCKTASYNFDCEKFFEKYLNDVHSMQQENGCIPAYVPAHISQNCGSAAWSDVMTILPYQLYLTYGTKKPLEDHFDMMENWVKFMIKKAKKEDVGDDFTKTRNIYIHNNQAHFGDWLALDLPDQEATGGATSHDLIATAFFAYSTELLIKTGEILGKDMEEYKTLYENIKQAFNEEFLNPDGTVINDNQTAPVLALHFKLLNNPRPVRRQLIERVKKDGHLTTGFVGTPYLLHVLSSIGESKLAYDLLLRKEYPSWCYPITQGATTMWERWNGYKPDGTFATPSMNSFNHYAYGAVGDWIYEHMLGIGQPDGSAGFEEVIFTPETDPRLKFAEGAIETRRGRISSRWEIKDDGTEFTFILPDSIKAKAIIDGKIYKLGAGLTKIIV